jgi:para-nitrobenzyl esterase
MFALAACGGDPTGPAASLDGGGIGTDASAPASRCVAVPSAPDDPLVVVTEAGELRGTDVGAASAFLGIPYAAPPVGEGRFRPPAAHACWEGVRPALAFGRVCPQLLASGGRFGDEDCLAANVWTPEARATTPRPVMVFIHGGAYLTGSGHQDLAFENSGNLYDGATLATEQGAVVVTFNYRLGALGFFAHPALVAEDAHGSAGNYGTLDQIALLQWVQTNIRAFGGDPDRVMIFGESAGGLSTCLLLATPLARGLFHGALVESGGCQVATAASRLAQGEDIADRLGCDDAACLRARPASDYVVAQRMRRPVDLRFRAILLA